MLIVPQQSLRCRHVPHQLLIAWIDDRRIQPPRHQQEKKALVQQLANRQPKGDIAYAGTNVNARIIRRDCCNRSE